MKKLKVLFLLLALHAANSINNRKQPKRLSQEPVPVKKIHTDSFDTLKLKDSVELYKHKLQNKKKHAKHVIENLLTKKRPSPKCEKLKCPHEEKPVCAELAFKNSRNNIKNKPFYVIMINECEINYSKCHRELEATIVPMENCHHKFFKPLSTETAKRRSKREVKADPIGDNESKIEGTIEIDDADLVNQNVETAISQNDVPKIEGTVKIDDALLNLSEHFNVAESQVPKDDGLKIEGTIEIEDADLNQNPREDVDLPDPVISLVKDLKIEGTIDMDDAHLNSNPSEHVNMAEFKNTQDHGPVIKGTIQIDDENQNQNPSIAGPEIPQENGSKMEGFDKLYDSNLNQIPSKDGQYVHGEIEFDDDTNTHQTEINKNKKDKIVDIMKADEEPSSSIELDFSEIENNNLDLPVVTEPEVDEDLPFNDPDANDYHFEPNPAPIISTVIDGDGNKELSNDENPSIDEANVASGDGVDDNNNGDKGAIDDEDIPNDVNVPSHPGDQFDIEVNEEQYRAECPTQCPSRGVMVCAVCQHGVYKTFLSVCHMRMFQCRNKAELIKLVSRNPCMMSAPYISEDPPMVPRGRVTEPGDQDPILRFIWCREKGKLTKTKDPKCSFDDHVKLNEELKTEAKDTSDY